MPPSTRFPSDAPQGLGARGRQAPCLLHVLRAAAGLPNLPAAEAGRVVTYQRGGESNHNRWPSRALAVAPLRADGAAKWDHAARLLFSRLLRAADARIVGGGRLEPQRAPRRRAVSRRAPF